MIFTFYRARGLATGKSLVEEDKMDLAKKLEEMAKAKGVELLLPVDVVVADKFDAEADSKVCMVWKHCCWERGREHGENRWKALGWEKYLL